MPTSLIKTQTMISVVDSQGKTILPGYFRTYEVGTTDPLKGLSEQLVGTSHEQLDAGDIPDGCMLAIYNDHETAIVSVGKDVAAVFEADFAIHPNDPPAILPRVSDISDWYLKSDTASTPVKILLIKIVDPV